MEYNFFELASQLQECKNESQLMKVATYISNNSKRLKLSDFDVDKLEQIGIRRYEEIKRNGAMLIRNTKIGSQKT